MATSSPDEQGDWQLNLSLAQCNSHMLTNRLACDVTFKVGVNENMEEIGAHKYMLMSRSPVFFNLFNGPFTDTMDTSRPFKVTDIPADAMRALMNTDFSQPIEVTDISAEVFQAMLEYLYTDETHLDESRALALIYASKKYMVSALTQYCATYLMSEVNKDNIARIYENLLAYDDKKLIKPFEAFLCGIFNTVCQSDTFMELKRATLLEMTSNNKLNISEHELFLAVVKWAKAVSTKQKEDAGQSIRDILGPVLYQIRCPTMKMTDFAQHVLSVPSVLTGEEEYLLLKGIATGECLQSSPFPVSAREPPLSVKLHQELEFENENNSGTLEMHLTTTQKLMMLSINALCQPESPWQQITITNTSNSKKYTFGSHCIMEANVTYVVCFETTPTTSVGVYKVPALTSVPNSTISVSGNVPNVNIHYVML